MATILKNSIEAKSHIVLILHTISEPKQTFDYFPPSFVASSAPLLIIILPIFSPYKANIELEK